MTAIATDLTAAARARRVIDGLLVSITVGLAFLLGCQELYDSDVWFHLRSGEWIVEHRAIPQADPFTFGAAGRLWIDLHWTFQVALAGAHRAGGVTGVILFAAAGAAAAVLVSLCSRRSAWPAWVVVAAWLPGLLLASSRFVPRPEVVTFICVASFLSILYHARRRPGCLWLLIPIQVVWGNAHGLFILGPWIVGLYLIDRAVAGRGAPPGAGSCLHVCWWWQRVW